MTKTKKPFVAERSVQQKARTSERIFEFNAGSTIQNKRGGSISFHDDGRTLTVSLYLLSGRVTIDAPTKHLVRNTNVMDLVTALHLCQSVMANLRAGRGTSDIDIDIAKASTDRALENFASVVEAVVSDEKVTDRKR